MKVIVDKLPETKVDCAFSKFHTIAAESRCCFRCILKEAYIDKECDGYEADNCIHCNQIISFNDMYKSQMEMQDCVVNINMDGYSCLICEKGSNDGKE